MADSGRDSGTCNASAVPAPASSARHARPPCGPWPLRRGPLKFTPAPADTAGMSHNLIDRIDQRTRLAGHNRLALLLFRLGGRQLFGVNVFKVREVLRRPGLFQVPGVPADFAGVAAVRGRSVPVLDLGRAIGHPGRDDIEAPGYLVVTEFNRSVQGFLVSDVERIVNIAVEDIVPPPDSGAGSSYLTAVTRYGGELIQVIATLLRMGVTKRDFDQTMPLHPSSAEELMTLRTRSARRIQHHDPQRGLVQ